MHTLIEYRDTPMLLEGPSPKWLPGFILDMNGQKTLIKGDNALGRVVSCQPDGTLSDRDPGTIGSWEVITLDSSLNVLRFTPDGIPYPVIYRGR